MKKIKRCTLEYDAENHSVSIYGLVGNILMKIKLTDGEGTMERIFPDPKEDCDNYWIGVKPSDSVVFDHILFDNCSVEVERFDFKLKGGKIRKRRGIMD